jgi:lipopolysaccharide assembly protein A
MSFLKTVFWVIVLVAFVVFSLNNWLPVSIRLWNDLWLDTKLPVLIAIAFLLGFAPLYIWYRTAHYRLNRRINTLESMNRSAPLDLRQVEGAPIGANP